MRNVDSARLAHISWVTVTEQLDLPAMARDLFAEVPWSNYVSMGDSLAEGIGDPVEGYPSSGFSCMVADGLRAVRPELQFTNLGKRELTARQVRETQLKPALALRPDLVTMIAGGNDLLLEKFDPAISQRELDTMVASLLDSGATVVIATMYDIFAAKLVPAAFEAALKERFEALNNGIRAVADSHPALFIDFARMPVCADPGIYSTDLRHGNMRGHAIGAEAVLRALAQRAPSVSRRV
jgi:lysophospholipase L1-like esterase